MPGRVHQSLLWLFRRDRQLAVELANRVLGQARPPDTNVDRDIIIDRGSVLQRPGLHDDDGIVELDLVLSVHRRDPGSSIRHIWIIEVQLGRDRSRAQAWADYLSAAAREFGVAPADVEILVISPSAAVRGWIRREVLPRMKSQPLIVEPDHVPWIDDLRAARERPEAAVMSAVFHGHELRAAKVVEAACRAIVTLEANTRDRYRYLIQTSAHEAMQLPQLNQAQPSQEPTPNETPSEWEQRGLTWAQHGARFAAQARRDALFIMFELVGLEPSSGQRALVENCDDLAKLESWSQRLKGASCLARVLRDD